MTDGAEIEFREVQNALSLLRTRGERVPQEMTGAIAASLHAAVLEVFETEGYGRWPGFWWEPGPKPKGRRWDGRTPRLLQDTGLLASVNMDHDADTAEVYTDVPYAKYHASRLPRRVIPLRDFFDIDREAFEQDVVDMLLYKLTWPTSHAAE